MRAVPGPASLHHSRRWSGPAQGLPHAGGGWGSEEEINTVSSGQRHGGSPLPGAPGGEEPPARPRALPSRPGALDARHRPGASSRRRGCTGGWAAACAVPAKPQRSRSQSGPAPPRLLLVSPSLPPSRPGLQLALTRLPPACPARGACARFSLSGCPARRGWLGGRLGDRVSVWKRSRGEKEEKGGEEGERRRGKTETEGRKPQRRSWGGTCGGGRSGARAAAPTTFTRGTGDLRARGAPLPARPPSYIGETCPRHRPRCACAAGSGRGAAREGKRGATAAAATARGMMGVVGGGDGPGSTGGAGGGGYAGPSRSTVLFRKAGDPKLSVGQGRLTAPF